MSDLIERAEAALEVIKAPIIAELIAALKVARVENDRLRLNLQCHEGF